MAVTKPKLSVLELAALILAILRTRSSSYTSLIGGMSIDHVQARLAWLPSSPRCLEEDLDLRNTSIISNLL